MKRHTSNKKKQTKSSKTLIKSFKTPSGAPVDVYLNNDWGFSNPLFKIQFKDGYDLYKKEGVK